MKMTTILLAVAVCVGFTGCGTLRDDGPSQANLLKKAENVTSIAVTIHLRNNPGDAANINEARVRLAALVLDTNAAPADLQGLIQSIPLKGDAALYRDAALILFGDYIGNVQSPLDAFAVHDFAAAVDRGIVRGLASVVPEPVKPQKRKKLHWWS